MVIHFEHFAVNREYYQWFAVQADLQLTIAHILRSVTVISSENIRVPNIVVQSFWVTFEIGQ